MKSAKASSTVAVVDPAVQKEKIRVNAELELAKDHISSYNRSLECSPLVLADSYKAGHFKMYPPAQEMCAYGEFREPFKGMADNRIVVYGLRYYIQQFVERLVTKADLTQCANFYSLHGLGSSAFAYPEKMFQEIVNSNGGRLPVKIEALPEGSVVYPHTPVFIITATGDYSRFCTFLETILTMVWYPSCVATLSRHTRDLIQTAFDKYVDSDAHWKIDSKLHDFGFRGCTCVEQSVLGGSAHLLNFAGSDTMSACSYVQYHVNGGRPVGFSLPATEHSVMTSWPNEATAILNLIINHPGKVIACVMDSYDYDAALDTILPMVKDALDAFNCVLVLRPDSGDPVQQVIKALKASTKAGYAFTVNSKDKIVFNNVCVIQGDGIGYSVVGDILRAVVFEGYSPENVAFGMGGGLLQKVNRDTMSFATKLSYIKYDQDGCAKLRAEHEKVLKSRGLSKAADVFHSDLKFGEFKEVMKAPASDSGKTSLPGKMMVLKEKRGDAYGPCTVFTEEEGRKMISSGMYVNAMITVYDHGPKPSSESFDEIRARVSKEWLSVPPNGNALHSSMKAKHDSVKRGIRDGDIGVSDRALDNDALMRSLKEIVDQLVLAERSRRP
jgi:nicotinic acid phosphoribosyltransferase